FVQSDGALDVASNFDIGTWTTVYNHGSVDVCDSLLGGDFDSVNNFGTSPFRVGDDFTLGDFSFVYDFDSSSVNVPHDFTLGNNGFVYNGTVAGDAASFTVGHNFTIGNAGAGTFDSGYAYNFGTSTFSVAGSITGYGDGGSYLYDGVLPSDAATLTVGGSVSLGASGYMFTVGTSHTTVVGDITLGNDGYLYNGEHSTDAAILTVDGNLTIGNPGAGPFDYRY